MRGWRGVRLRTVNERGLGGSACFWRAVHIVGDASYGKFEYSIMSDKLSMSLDDIVKESRAAKESKKEPPAGGKGGKGGKAEKKKGGGRDAPYSKEKKEKPPQEKKEKKEKPPKEKKARARFCPHARCSKPEHR